MAGRTVPLAPRAPSLPTAPAGRTLFYSILCILAMALGILSVLFVHGRAAQGPQVDQRTERDAKWSADMAKASRKLREAEERDRRAAEEQRRRDKVMSPEERLRARYPDAATEAIMSVEAVSRHLHDERSAYSWLLQEEYAAMETRMNLLQETYASRPEAAKASYKSTLAAGEGARRALRASIVWRQSMIPPFAGQRSVSTWRHARRWTSSRRRRVLRSRRGSRDCYRPASSTRSRRTRDFGQPRSRQVMRPWRSRMRTVGTASTP